MFLNGSSKSIYEVNKGSFINATVPRKIKYFVMMLQGWVMGWYKAHVIHNSFTWNAILLITRIIWIQNSFTCYVYLINFYDFSSSVVYSDQLFAAARHTLNILSDYNYQHLNSGLVLIFRGIRYWNLWNLMWIIGTKSFLTLKETWNPKLSFGCCQHAHSQNWKSKWICLSRLCFACLHASFKN